LGIKIAQAGYSGHYELDENRKEVFTFGPCVVSCETEAYILSGDLTDGEVGVDEFN
jgi:hypothetical protein